MASRIVLVALVVFCSACGFSQLPQSGCNGIDKAFQGCFPAGKCPIRGIPTLQRYALAEGVLDIRKLRIQRLYLGIAEAVHYPAHLTNRIKRV
jgi:hypothetical protein